MVQLIKGNEEALEQNILSDAAQISPKGNGDNEGIELVMDGEDPFGTRNADPKNKIQITDRPESNEELEKEKKREARKRRQENMRNKLNNADRIIEENSRMQQKMQELEKELSSLKNLATQYQTGTLDKEINDAELKIQYYESQLEEAISNADGKQARVVQNLIREESNKQYRLKLQKEEQLKNLNQPNQQHVNQYDPFKAPETIHYLNEFKKEHSWIDSVDPEDEVDRKMVYQIDLQIAREGYNPTSPAYWNELRRRVREIMPDRYDNYEPQKVTPVQASTTAQQQQPVAGKHQIRLKDLTQMQRDILVRQGHIGTDGSIKNKEKVTYYVTQWYKNK